MASVEAAAGGDAERIAVALGGRRAGNGWTARCPAHDDATPSLSIGDGRSGVVVRCHAGCAQDAVVAALRERRLWPTTTSTPSPVARRPGRCEYAIHDIHGTVVAHHVRRDVRRADGSSGKRMSWRLPDGRTTLAGRPASSLPLYGTERLAAAEPGATVIVTEGERAADALLAIGALAVGTVTGAQGTPADDVLRVLVPYDVVLWPDHDDVGEQHMRRIADRLAAIGVTARWLRWPDAQQSGDDAADYAERGGAADTLAALVHAAPRDVSLDVVDCEDDDATSPGRPSQATVLLEMLADVEVWHTSDGEPYATLRRDGHGETHALRSRAMREYAAWRYYAETGRPLRPEARGEALDAMAARARWEGAEHRVWLRVAQHGDAIYLDLGDETWRAAEVTPAGWRIVADPPVRFRRAATTLALPVPVSGGALVESLRSLLRVEADDDLHQLVGWLLAALRPVGPYPVLALGGEPGASKSTTARILRSLVDPCVAPLRSEPREVRDLIIAARNGWLVAIDNVSRVQPWLSDALCRLSTGGGYSTRELYSDLDEVVVDVQRPVILTAIEDVCTRSDLADRALAITLPAMPESARRPERELWAAVEHARPVLLGALLDVVVRGLRELPDVRLDGLPRMADYATWLAACEPALDVEGGTMVAAYTRGRQSMTATTIEASPVATALVAWAAARPEPWEGTASALLDALVPHAAEDVRRDRQRWPQTPRALSGALRRLAPALRAVGVRVDWPARAGQRRGVTVTTVTTVTTPAAEGAASDGRDGRRDGGCRLPSLRRAAPAAADDGGDGDDGSAPVFSAAAEDVA